MSDVKIDDRAWRKLLATAHKLDKAHVKVGVLASKGGDNKHPDSDFTMIELAAVHELGNEHVPERSFIRGTLEAKEDEIVKIQEKLARGVVTDKMSPEKALAILGTSIQSMIKNRITEGEGIPPPLDPATIAAKGSDRPLVDTGRLLGSIQYEVSDGKDES